TQTSSRLVASPSLIGADNLEKDFAWGDFDRDGDTDLVCMRKFPGSIQGGFRDILFMNEGGVLVDRTLEFGSASDISGYQGMLDPCNDRDVEAVDLDLDGWLDLITATTMSDHVNSILGQPRVYRNLGNDPQGNWRGFRFEVDRIPDLFARNGTAANPRFCDAAVGDFNGDGYPDVFYTDYDTPETSGTICYDLNADGDTNDPGECQQSPAENPANDFDSKLLLNRGTAAPGFFIDATTTVLTTVQIDSAFGNMAVAGEFSGDGRDDIVRINTLTTGQNVAIMTKTATTPGFNYKVIATGQPYHGDKADLNGDGRLDLVIVDDGKDKYLLNTGNDASGQPNFTSYTIEDSLTEFGNTTQCGDLDNDGRIDVIITDVDADLGPFCPQTAGAAHSRRTHIYRNVFNGSPTDILDEITPLVIPAAELDWWTDVAILDINGDGWLDLVAGTCTGTVVYINIPPIGLTFGYPGGRPQVVAPGQPIAFRVSITPVGGGTVVPGTAKLWTRRGAGAFVDRPLMPQPDGTYMAGFPALSCGENVEWYVTAGLSNGAASYADPATAPAQPYALSIQTGTSSMYGTAFEDAAAGWTVTNQGGLTTGAWQLAVPVGTTSGTYAAAPASDASAVGTRAWVTQNGTAGGTASAADVDTGTTRLTSPAFDLSMAASATLNYSAWYFCSDAAPAGSTPAEVDPLVVEASMDDGATWVTIDSVSSYPVPNGWMRRSIPLRPALADLTSAVRIRFSISDTPDNSITEAGIDEFAFQVAVCEHTCVGDLNADSYVDGTDLGALLGQWGSPGTADFNGDGLVDGNDLGMMLGVWGPCP
ncbi:MAG: FG-GAP-like repeat-containing protein, partial [Phycisphaerales bacterium]